ncbi:MAG: hypothetical protein JST68_16375 [Bacteroidetes bacterium]|nr:hypothetical protein [Bacteroidota bacterium]
MRKKLILLPVALFLAVASFAQTAVEFIPQGGYTFASRTDYPDLFGRVNGNGNLGAALKFNVNRSFGIEVLYSHMSTTSGLYYYDDHSPYSQGDVKLDYIMIGPVQSFTIPGSTVRPFIGAMLGAAVISPDLNSSFTKFAAGFQLGTNIYVSPRVGLQLKAQLLSPVDAAGGSLFFSNYGSGGGISTYSSMYQFSLNAGLIIGLGPILPEQVFHRPARRPGPRYHRYYY